MLSRFGLGLGGLTRGSGGVRHSDVAIGSTIGVIGDGTGSDGAAASVRNGPNQMMLYLNMRACPAPMFNFCRSGDTFALMTARVPFFNSMKCDIVVVWSFGHNDALMTTDPDIDATQINAWKVLAQLIIDGNTGASKIFFCSTIGSSVAAEGNASSAVPAQTLAQRVRSLQQAWVLAKALPDRIIYVALGEAYDPPNMSPASDASKVHPDERGGYALGYQTLGPAVGAHIVAKTKSEIQEMLRGGTYPNLTGTQFDTDVLMQGGTAGTKSGTNTPTGNVATGKNVTNNMTGTSAIVCALDTSDPTFTVQTITVSGTPAAQSTFNWKDTASISITGSTRSQLVLTTWGVKFDNGSGSAPTGIHNYGGDFGNFGQYGTGTDLATGVTADLAYAMDTIIPTQGRPFFSSAGPFSANPQLTVRHSLVALTAKFYVDRPQIHLPANRTKVSMMYLGTMPNASSNYVLRPTGTISQATGGTITVEPGWWNVYDPLETDFIERRIYKGVAGDTGIGSGTLIGTISGSTWSKTFIAGDVTTNDKIWVEVDGNNGIGSTYTARCAVANVVTAT
jgi:hypothetical protein